MKYLANLISVSRIIVSIIMFFISTLTIPFWILYCYCGISDMLDGYFARKSNNVSLLGSKLDSIGDIIFVLVSIYKMYPFIYLNKFIIIWIGIIILIRMFNIIYGYISIKKVILLHTIGNKISGLLLFISSFILIKYNCFILDIIICLIASFASIEECYYIIKKRVV